MTGIFRQKTPANIILLLILGMLLKLPAFFHPRGYVIKDGDGVLYTRFIAFLSQPGTGSPFVFALIAFILNMTIAFTLNQFINANRLMNKPNFLVGMAYILSTSLLPSFNLLSSNLFSSVLLLLVFILFFRSHNLKAEKNPIFNAAFLVGLASLFFFPALFFIAWVFIALAILRPFSLSEWAVALLGLTTPYYFYAAFLFLTDDLHIPGYFYQLSFLSSGIRYTAWHAGALFFLLAPLFAGIYYIQANSGKMIIHVRKGWYLFLWYLAAAIIISFFDIEKTSENVVMALTPVAALHGYGYLNAELKIYPKIAFWLTVVFIVASQLYSNLW